MDTMINPTKAPTANHNRNLQPFKGSFISFLLSRLVGGIVFASPADALSEFEQEHNKQAEGKRQQRFQNKISVWVRNEPG